MFLVRLRLLFGFYDGIRVGVFLFGGIIVRILLDNLFVSDIYIYMIDK